MRPLVQPGDGVAPLIKAINGAKRSIEISIFRFDRREVEKALVQAAARGVSVHALIASTNRGGEKNLRELETRLLAGGITVARTADDLVRYHGKFMIIDRRELHLLAFNFTYSDIERSRSFGVITSNKRLVQEAAKLFEADSKRQDFKPGTNAFVVSPVNARKVLSEFIRGARTELLLYDPKISDPAMCRAIEERAKAGVDVRLLGRMTRRNGRVQVRSLSQRMHTRTILRDRTHAFIGSQSLRPLELDARREVGVIFRDRAAVKTFRNVFEKDWTASQTPAAYADQPPALKVAKKIARVVTREMPAVVPIVEGAVKQLTGPKNEVELNPEQIEHAVKDAVKQAVKTAVQEVIESIPDAAAVTAPDQTRAAGGK